MIKQLCFGLIAASSIVLCADTAQATCAKEPTIEFVAESFDLHSKIAVETIAVDGKKWTHRYLKSGVPGIVRYDVLPDCSVWIIGRKGLDYFVVVNDVEWENSVYNSDFVLISKDGKKILQADSRGTIIVNDVVQEPLEGKLIGVRFDDEENVVATLINNGLEVVAINGKVIRREWTREEPK